MLPFAVVGAQAVLGSGPCAVVGPVAEVLARAREVERAEHPRWLVPSAGSALRRLVEDRVPLRRCWDVAEAHRLLHGGWAGDLPRAWASVRGLEVSALPARAGEDLFGVACGGGANAQDEGPVRPDGHLRPDLLDAGWCRTAAQLRALAAILLEVGRSQEAALQAVSPRGARTAHSESAAAVLCLELERDGLPVDRRVAEELIAAAVGRRPRDDADARALRRERDLRVLRHAPGREGTDLRNPVQVRDLLTAVGIRVASTRAQVLEPFRSTHPLVDALLRWRKEERIATTYGYRWLDEHVGPDDRLRGTWTACDGAAGRMTAQHGLHNLPVPLRPAIVAGPGHLFVRADLGQVEPRVLAVVSGDDALAEATRADDLYAPVASRLGVERPAAKIAVLAAMYGQRTGTAGSAFRGLERAYPVAMRLLDDAYAAGLERRTLRTFGGRLIPLHAALPALGPSDVPSSLPSSLPSDPAGLEGRPGSQEPALDAARGRFARNAVIQGAAAELFKAWAATVRHAAASLDADIVLCLHDELLVHVPQERAAEADVMVRRCLEDSARRWSGTSAVRFVAATSVVRRWSDVGG